VMNYGDAGFVGSSVTAADGKYIIPVAQGAGTYNLTAQHRGFTFNCTSPGGAVALGASNIANVNFTRIRATRTVSGSVVVAGRSYNPTTDGPLAISDGTQTVMATTGSWTMNIADGTTAQFTATPANPAYTVLNYFPNPYFVVDNYNLLHFDVKIPGQMPETGFATASGTSDDTVGTVQVPIQMSLPAAYSSWVADQSVYCWVDDSSTAEYGVDYRLSGGRITFRGGAAPTIQFLPLRIIHDGVPKSKTVVIKMKQATSITNLGPTTTFTHTINNQGAGVDNWMLY
jgi:hypothetical protein